MRGQRLKRVEPAITRIGDRRWVHYGNVDNARSRTGEWSQQVEVAGRRYYVRVGRGRSVRIPYKPRGHNIGFRWYAEVYSVDPHAKVWDGEVGKSLGVRGILIDAGIVREVTS